MTAIMVKKNSLKAEFAHLKKGILLVYCPACKRRYYVSKKPIHCLYLDCWDGQLIYEIETQKCT